MALAHSSFALALIALHLPDLPGLTLARRLRQAPAPVGAMPIIMFGDAWDPERILDGCREAGSPATCPSRSRSRGWSPRSTTTSTARRASPERAPTMPQPPAFERRAPDLLHRRRPPARARADLALPGDGGRLSRRDARRLAGGGGWAKAAHALKGASANIGAAAVARLAEEAEHGGPSTDRLARLDAALEAVRAFLRHACGRPCRAPRPGAGALADVPLPACRLQAELQAKPLAKVGFILRGNALACLPALSGMAACWPVRPSPSRR